MDPVSVALVLASGVGTNAGVKAFKRKFLGKEKQEWLVKFKAAADEICPKYNVPPQVCVAQASLESGWGKSAPHFNYFGLKGGSGPAVTTKEFKDGAYVVTQSKFQQFASMEDGIVGYCKAMNKNPNFAAALKKYPNDPAKFAAWIWGMGYASAPNYVSTLVGVMQTIYRATEDAAYNVHTDAALNKIVAKLKDAEMGKERRVATTKLLGEGASFSGVATYSLAGGDYATIGAQTGDSRRPLGSWYVEADKLSGGAYAALAGGAYADLSRAQDGYHRDGLSGLCGNAEAGTDSPEDTGNGGKPETEDFGLAPILLSVAAMAAVAGILWWKNQPRTNPSKRSNARRRGR